MTLKIRNRLNLIFSALSAAFLLFNIIFMIYEIVDGNFHIPEPSYMRFGNTFLTSYHPRFVLVILLLEMLYACVTFFILYNIFEKTQSSEVVYFSLFVLSILLDSSRFWIILFDLPFTFTNKAVWCQHIILCSKILSPLSLFILTIMSEPEKRQYTEQNIVIVAITSLAFGNFDTINTGELLPNFCFVYSYARSIRIATVIVLLASILWLYLENRKKMLSNKITIGFAMVCFGFLFLTESSMPITLTIGLLLLIAGTFEYLIELHNQYLWNN